MVIQTTSLIEDVRRFETSLLKFVENSHPGLLAEIAEKKTLTDEIKAGLKQVLEDFKAGLEEAIVQREQICAIPHRHEQRVQPHSQQPKDVSNAESSRHSPAH